MRLDSLEITQLGVHTIPISTERALQAPGLNPIGQASHSLADDKISQKPLRGVSVTVERVDASSPWELRGVSIIGVMTQGGRVPPLYRAYLLAPEHFGMINKVLATMVLDGKVDRILTSQIMQFLTKLVRNDSRFASLILDTIDLRQFIHVNLLTDEQAHIHSSVEFLRCLSGEARFAQDLFEILIAMVQNELAVTIPPRRGYEAIIGMLNWVLPLDAERSLKVLMDTLYTKVCLERLPTAQTPEAVSFRTRCALQLSTGSESFLEHFPFDQALLRPICPEDSKKTGSKTQKEGEGDGVTAKAHMRHLLRNVMIVSKRIAKCQIFGATFSAST